VILIAVLCLASACSRHEAYETSLAVNRANQPGHLAVLTSVSAVNLDATRPDSGFRIFSIAPGQTQVLTLDSESIPGRSYVFDLSVTGKLESPVLKVITSVRQGDDLVFQSRQTFTQWGIQSP